MELLLEEEAPEEKALAATGAPARVARRSRRTSIRIADRHHPQGAVQTCPTTGQALSAWRTSSGLADSSGLCERLAPSL